MSNLERLGTIPRHLADVFLSVGSQFSLFSLATAFCVAIGFLAWRQHRRRGRVSLAAIRRAVFRSRFVFRRTVILDIIFFLLNTLALGVLIGWAMFGADSVSRSVVNVLTSTFGPRAPVDWPEFPMRAGVTLALFVAYEFGYWVDHYLKHRVPFLWETHKPHHSAEALTPWTVWRVHPLDTLVFTNILALAIGGAGGLIAYGLGREAKIFTIGGGNILLVFFIYAYAHLQHSQFWIPFTGPFARVFMSPAQHQIHHSIDPAHHNKNFGSSLSVFDWLFGTLELPSVESPRLKFGVDTNGADPHSVRTALITPVVASFRLLVSGVSGVLGAGLTALLGRAQPR